MTNVAIVGLGVLGRKVFRMLYEEFSSYDLNLVFVNDTNDTNQLLYLLKYDTVYGKSAIDFDPNVTIGTTFDTVYINGKPVYFYHESDISKIPLDDRAVQIVLDCTGAGYSMDQLSAYITDKVRNVIVCDQTSRPDMLAGVWGITQGETPGQTFITIPPGQTIADAIAANVVNESFGINKATVIDVGSYTNLNNLQDSPIVSQVSTPQNGRAGAWNLIRSGKTYAKGVGHIIAGLNGILYSEEIRSGTIRGAMSYGTYFIIHSFDESTLLSNWKGISESSISDAITNEHPFIGYSEKELVSSDVVGEPFVIYCNNAKRTSDDTTMMLNVVYDPIVVQAANALAIAQYVAKNG